MLREDQQAAGQPFEAKVPAAYASIFAQLVSDVMGEEGRAVVGEAVQAVASEYVSRRGAERALDAIIDSGVRDVTRPRARPARVEVIYEALLLDTMVPLAREVCVTALSEARGAAARRRTAQMRSEVAAVASQGLLEQLLLQRLLQHIATGGEALLLQRQAARLLDQMVAEGLARRSLATGQAEDALSSSYVMGRAHEVIVYSAMVDEMLAQLVALGASGLEQGVPDTPSESDESDDERIDAPGRVKTNLTKRNVEGRA